MYFICVFIFSIVYVRDNPRLVVCALNEFNARRGGKEPPDVI